MSAWTTPQTWTDERVAELKQLWGEGLSASQIARALGGVTRNGVIGKIHRLGLAGRAGPRRTYEQSGTGAPKPPPPPEAPQPLVLENGQHVTTITLTHRMCRYPLGDPALPDFHYCGVAHKEGSPYCAYHHHVCFVALPKPRGGRRAKAEPLKEAA